MLRTTLTLLPVCALAALTSISVPVFEVVREGPPVEDRGISRGAAWGDFDGDGDADLYVTRPTYENRPQRNALYRNDAGRFARVRSDATAVPAAGWEGAAWVDADGDGDLDLSIVGREGAGAMFFENAGDGELTRRLNDPLGTEIGSASMACWADADGDGRLDVFIAGSGDGRNALFRNVGRWRFERVALPDHAAGEGAARACIWGDLDGDGFPELVVANARQPNLLLRNRGDMEFVSDTMTGLQRDTAYSYGVSFTDVNGDGLRDLFVANFDAGNSLYLGRADGSLERVTLGAELQSVASKGHVWGDFDLDGRIDLYLGSGTPRPGMLNQLWLGTDSGFRLSTEGEYAAHADTSAAVAGADYDLDGDIDLFVANWGSEGSANRLYENTATRRGWLRVELEGVEANRMGVGSRASVLIGWGDASRWLHRWLDASTGYAGQNEPVLHFGLGEAERVDSLVVSWPSGRVDRFGPVRARSSVIVREGAPVPAIR